jgi:hypothetical protein
MKFYPDNPFFYWAEQAAREIECRRARRIPHKPRGLRVVASIQDREQRSLGGGVVGFQNLKMLFEMFNKLNRLSIDKFGEPIPLMHRNLFITMASCALPKMFGKDYDFYKRSLLQQFGMDYQRRKIAASMPRRWGKSVCTAQYAGCYGWSQRQDTPLKIIVVSMTRDISKLLTKTIVDVIIELSDSSVVFDTKNSDEIEFVNPHGTRVIIKSKICTTVSFLFVTWVAAHLNVRLFRFALPRFPLFGLKLH